MAEPTSVFRQFPNNTATTAVDTPAERLAAIAGESTVSTGAGNELDFGTVDISGGAADSGVENWIWHISADGGNTTAEDFRLWMSTNGFDQAGTVLKFVATSGADQGTPSSTANYVASATTASYTFANLPESLPGAQNVYPTDEGTSMTLSTTSDDGIMAAMYLAVASGETTGTYKGTDAGYEFQFSFRYTYS